MKNAVIYIRVSTEEQAKHGYSIDAQIKSCELFASQNGYAIYQDNLKKVLTTAENIIITIAQVNVAEIAKRRH